MFDRLLAHGIRQGRVTLIDHLGGRQTFGHSLVVDPWGEILLDMGEEKGVGFADLDLARIPEVRSRIPALNHRRPIPEAVIS